MAHLRLVIFFKVYKVYFHVIIKSTILWENLSNLVVNILLMKYKLFLHQCFVLCCFFFFVLKVYKQCFPFLFFFFFAKTSKVVKYLCPISTFILFFRLRSLSFCSKRENQFLGLYIFLSYFLYMRLFP